MTYANFSVERAFSPKAAAIRVPALPSRALMMGGLFLLAAVGIGSYTLTNPALRDSPAIEEPSANMPVISNARFPDAMPAIPAPQSFAVAVDKANRVLMVLEEKEDHYQVVRTFDISLGKIIGDKQKAGDQRTPSGYYHIVEIKDASQLPSYYGPRAFVTDYPNSFDIAHGRTGGGIWLHGSGLGRRTRDSRGCVVLDDDNVKTLDNWVRVNTPVAIFPDNFPLPVMAGKVEKRYFKPEFFYSGTNLANRS